jgi:hypothetical protein
MSPPDDLIAGRYRRQQLVGSGGMGTVWEAWDELLDRRVALKELHSAPGLTAEEAELANERALREARITARLSHRHAVPVFDVVQHAGRPCIVMPFIPSETLSAVLREGGPLAVEEAAGVGAQVSAALAAAHAAGIVHRDVKPGNILIADDGAAMISDFGISHALGDVTLTSTGEVHGTPAYLAPEVARGREATTASDVFSLGSTLYAALEGAPPFGADTNSIALLHKVAAGEFPPPQQAGPMAPLLQAMLSPDPADRPPMGAVASTLKGLTGESSSPPAATVAAPAATAATVAAVPATAAAAAASRPEAAAADPDPLPATPARRPRRPTRTLAAVAALVVAGILAGLLWVQLGNPGGIAARDGAESDPSGGATPPAGSPAPSADATTDSSPAPGATGTAAPKPSASAPATSAPPSATRAPTTSSAPEPEPTRTRVSDTPSAEDLSAAVRSYYALMPEGTDQGWSRLTESYQRGEARSRRYYESFWGQFREVEVSNASGRPPNRAEATLTYRYKSGRVDVERRAFRFVNDDGQLKISESYVVSPG